MFTSVFVFGHISAFKLGRQGLSMMCMHSLPVDKVSLCILSVIDRVLLLDKFHVMAEERMHDVLKNKVW